MRLCNYHLNQASGPNRVNTYAASNRCTVWMWILECMEQFNGKTYSLWISG